MLVTDYTVAEMNSKQSLKFAVPNLNQSPVTASTKCENAKHAFLTGLLVVESVMAKLHSADSRIGPIRPFRYDFCTTLEAHSCP